MSSSISVALSATVAPFKAQMVAAGEAVRTFSGEVQAAAVKNDKAVRAMSVGMAAVGASAVAMAAVSVKSAIDLEERMQNVATIWTDTSTTVTAAGNQIVEMSRHLPQSANNLAEGLYQVASSGFQGAAGMQVLQASATAASAGLTATAVAATGITAVLNAYGMSAGQAAHVSDVLFQTVNLGVVTFEQLSNTLGDFVGIASVAGISIEDATAAFATMTLSGLNASEAGTAVSRVIQAIIQPSKEMAATLSAAGYASGQAALDALGLKGVIELLNQATGGSATAMGVLVPEMRAYRGVLALTADDGGNYTRVSAGMTDQSALLGATQRALAEQAKSTSFQFGIFKNTVAAVGLEFGQSLLPVIKPVIALFQGLADTFLALPGPVQVVVAGVGFLAAAAIGLAGAFLLLAPSISAATTLIGESAVAMGVLQGAMTGLQSAMPVIAAIGVALAIATPLVLSWAKAHGDAKRQVDDLAKSLDQEKASVTDATTALITDQIVKQGLNKTADDLGISLDTLTSAMLGNKDAIAQVHEKTALTAEEQAALNDRVSEGSAADYGAVDAKTKLVSAVDGGNKALGKAIAQTQVHAQVEGAATRATKEAAAASDEKAQADLDQANAVTSLAGALSGMSSLSAAVSAASTVQSSGQSSITDTVKSGVNERQQVEKDALSATQKAEKDSLEARNATVKDALAARQKIETDALALTQRAVTDALDLRFRTENDAFAASNKAEMDALDIRFRAENDALAASNRAEMDALDIRFRAESDAYDREASAEKDALDNRQRAERDALDDRLALLDEEYDKRKTAENRAYQAEVDRIQGLIDDTFGDEREGHKRDLTALEDAHTERLDALDNQKAAEGRTQKEALDDKQQTEKGSLDDQLLAVKENIADRQNVEKQAVTDRENLDKEAIADRQAAEKQAVTDRENLDKEAIADQQNAEKTAAADAYTAQVAALGLRHDTEKAALDTRLTDLTNNLDLQQQAVTHQLEARQTAEDNAADARRSSGQAKHVLTLADVQTQMDELNHVQAQALVDLQTIYTRGGGDVTVAMLTEIQKLPPQVVTELANAGQPAFDQFMGSLRTSLKGVDPVAVAKDFGPIGQAAGAGIGAGLLAGLNAFLAAPPGAGGGGGLLGVPLSGIFPPAPGPVHRAAGGPIAAGVPYLVGEHGPELRTFDQPGSIVPADVSAGLSRWAQSPSHGFSAGSGPAAAGGTTISMPITIDVQARVDAGIDMGTAGKAIAKQINSGITAALDDVARKVKAR